MSCSLQSSFQKEKAKLRCRGSFGTQGRTGQRRPSSRSTINWLLTLNSIQNHSKLELLCLLKSQEPRTVASKCFSLQLLCRCVFSECPALFQPEKPCFLSNTFCVGTLGRFWFLRQVCGMVTSTVVFQFPQWSLESIIHMKLYIPIDITFLEDSLKLMKSRDFLFCFSPHSLPAVAETRGTCHLIQINEFLTIKCHLVYYTKSIFLIDRHYSGWQLALIKFTPLSFRRRESIASENGIYKSRYFGLLALTVLQQTINTWEFK